MDKQKQPLIKKTWFKLVKITAFEKLMQILSAKAESQKQ